MNWYRLAQFYEDIVKEPGETDSYFHANQYFSIGQNEETTSNSSCWIWIDDRLYSKIGGTHNMDFGHLCPQHNVERYYRGWYDPEQQLLSIVIPRKVDSMVEETDIPNSLDNVLRKKFGDDFQYRVF